MRTTQTIEVEYIEPQSACRRTTANISEPVEAPSVHLDLSGGHWRLVRIYRDAALRTLSVVKIFLNKSDLELVRKNRNCVAHIACEWTIGTAISSTIDVAAGHIEMITALSADRLIHSQAWPVTGPALAAHLDSGSGKIRYEDAA